MGRKAEIRRKVEILKEKLEEIFDILQVDMLRVSRGECIHVNPAITKIIPELEIFLFDRSVQISGKLVDHIVTTTELGKRFRAFKPKKHFGVVIMRRGIKKVRVDINDYRLVQREGVKIHGVQLIPVRSPYLGDWEDGVIKWR